MLAKGGTTSWKAISRWRSTCRYTRIDQYVQKDSNTELERLTGGAQVCDDHHHVAELIYQHQASTHVPFALLLDRFVYVHHAPVVGGALLGVPLPASSGSFSGTFILGILKELDALLAIDSHDCRVISPSLSTIVVCGADEPETSSDPRYCTA